MDTEPNNNVVTLDGLMDMMVGVRHDLGLFRLQFYHSESYFYDTGDDVDIVDKVDDDDSSLPDLEPIDIIKPVIIKFSDGQAFKTDDLYIEGGYVDYKRVIIYQPDQHNIVAMYHLPVSGDGVMSDCKDELERIVRGQMGWYGGNQNTFNRFVDYIVNKLNNGGIRQFYII